MRLDGMNDLASRFLRKFVGRDKSMVVGSEGSQSI